MKSWAEAEWFLSRPEVPKKITVTVFFVKVRPMRKTFRSRSTRFPLYLRGGCRAISFPFTKPTLHFLSRDRWGEADSDSVDLNVSALRTIWVMRPVQSIGSEPGWTIGTVRTLRTIPDGEACEYYWMVGPVCTIGVERPVCTVGVVSTCPTAQALRGVPHHRFLRGVGHSAG